MRIAKNNRRQRKHSETNLGALQSLEDRRLLTALDGFEVDDSAGLAGEITDAEIPQERTIHVGTDVDWARFTLDEQSRVTLQTAGASGDTRMWLYGPDSATNQIAYDDDGGPGAFSFIREYLQSGEYFVKIDEYGQNSAIDRYTLDLEVVSVASLMDSFENDDTPALANPLPVDTPQHHSIHIESDIDWYVFTLDTPSRVELETDGESGNTYLQLFDSDLNQLKWDAYSGNDDFSLIVEYLESGTYYASVNENYADATIDAYSITLETTPLSELVDAYEPDDTVANATVLPSDGSTSVHNIHIPTDVDWFVFTLDTPSKVELETDGESGNTYLQLFDSELNQLKWDAWGGNGGFSLIVEYLNSGTYYASVNENYQDTTIDAYTMALLHTPLSELADDYEPNDVSTNATPLVSGTTQTHNLHDYDDVDWFRFSIATPSLVEIDTQSEGPGSADLYLFNSDNELVVDSAYRYFDINLSAGDYRLGIIDDGRDQVIERYTIDFEATPLPDMAVTQVELDARQSLVAGSTVTVTWDVANAGAGTASSHYDRIYISSDNQPGDDDSVGSVWYSNQTAGGDSYQQTADITLPDNLYWAGRDAWLIVQVETNYSLDDVDESDNYLAVPISFRSHLQITSPTSGPRVSTGNDFEIDWMALDGNGESPVRLAVDSDSDPANGVGHTWLAGDQSLLSDIVAGRYSSAPDSQTTMVSLPDVPAREEPYFLWISMSTSDGIEYSEPVPIYVTDYAASFAEDEIGDAVGGAGFEVFGLDTYQDGNQLTFRVRTNYNPNKPSYTGNSSGGGDLRLATGGRQYALAVNNHQAGSAPVVAGDLYVDAEYLPGTTVSSVPSFIDSYGATVSGISTVSTAEIDDADWQYELIGTVDLSQLPGYEFGDSVGISWAMYCGNDTDTVVVVPDEPDTDDGDGSVDFVATRIERYDDENGGGVELYYEIVADAGVSVTAAQMALYWATGMTADERQGDGIFTQQTDSMAGEFGPIRVPAEDLIGQSPETWYLQFVIDQSDAVEESSEDNNVVVLSPLSAHYNHLLFEYLAREIIYRRDSDGWQGLERFEGQMLSQVPDQSGVVDVEGWKIEKVWNGSTGFQAAAFTSFNSDPIIVFRGTEPDRALDIFTDLHPDGIGINQYHAHRSEIAAWLDAYDNVSFVGHSLGGALAQWFAADVTEGGSQIGEVVTFNSPGIESDHAGTFRPQLSRGVTHYIVNGDIVTMGGEAFLEGQYVRFNYDTTIVSTLTDNHLLPLLLPSVLSGPTEIRSRPAIEQREPARTTGWLSSPMYFHTDPEYLLILTGINAAVYGAEAATGEDLAPLMLLRQTMESNRQVFGNWLYQYLDVVTFSTDPASIAVGFPELDFSIGSLVDVKASGLRVKYEGPSERLILQGEIELTGFYGDGEVVADFTGENYLQYTPVVSGAVDVDLNDGWEAIGRVEIDDLVIVPGKWELDDAYIEFDTIQNEVTGSATLEIPGGVELSATLGIENRQLSQLHLEADDLNRPIAATGAFLQSIAGDVLVRDPGDASSTVFTGEVGATYGPEMPEFSLPSWLGGYTLEGALANFELQASIDLNHLTGHGSVEVLLGLASGQADAELNWDRGFVSASGQFDILAGLASGSGQFRADSNWNLTMAAGATVRLPDIPWTPLDGQELASGNYRLQYLQDGTYSNDFVAMWGTLDLGLLGSRTIGFRYSLDGDWDTIGSVGEIDQFASTGLQLRSSALASSVAAPEARYVVDANSEMVMLHTEWAADVGDSAYEIVGPDGTVYRSTDVASDPEMEEIDAFRSTRSRTIGIVNPTPGTWTIRDITGGSSEDVQFRAYGDVELAQITIDETQSAEQSGTVVYSASSESSGSVIHFYASDAPDVAGGVYLGSSTGDSGTRSFEFSLTGLSAGDYYVHAVLNDGTSIPVSAGGSVFTVLGEDGGGNTDPQPVEHALPEGGGTYEILRDGSDLVLRVASGAELVRQAAESVTVLTVTGSADADAVVVLDTGNVVSTPISFSGGDGDDRFDASSAIGSVTLGGNDGNDVLIGGAADDELTGHAGGDSIFGGGGDDTLLGGAQRDFLSGGAGDDEVFGNGSTLDTLSGGLGNDTLTGGGFSGGGNDRLFEEQDADMTLLANSLSGIGNDVLDGITSAILIGGSSANTLDASGFNRFLKLIGNAGNDTLIGGTDFNLLAGNGGSDTLLGNENDDTIRGGAGSDSMVGGPGDDLLFGQGSSGDRLSGGPGNDLLNGGRGVDRLFEVADVDFTLTTTSLAGVGTDVVQAIEIAELVGGASGNTIDVSAFDGGPRGFVVVRGNGGDDFVIGSNGPDLLNGGEGDDTLQGKEAADTLNGDAGQDALSGHGGNDLINGGDGHDIGYGGNGNDSLNGERGVDILIGGDDDDVVLGGNGREDTLVGGTGSDDASPLDDISDLDAIIDEVFNLNPLPDWVDQI